MKDLPVRKNIRLEGYDYSRAGCYFVTICVKDRHNILWDAQTVGAACGRPSDDGRSVLSETGLLIDTELKKIANIYKWVKIDNYVIMPNHVHMIISLSAIQSTDGRPTISRIVNQFKGSISKQLGYSIWQKLFHDHIIRNEDEYQRIWCYIDENPARWAEDKYFV